MKIGFTGTRHGMTDVQKRVLKECIEALLGSNGKGSTFTHGDCIGADAEAHRLVRRFFPGMSITVAPSKIDNLRAYCEGDTAMVPDDPLSRNVNIVCSSEYMLACPAEFDEQPRGGTWFTIRAARRAAKQMTIIYPDGSTGNG